MELQLIDFALQILKWGIVSSVTLICVWVIAFIIWSA